MKDKIHIIRHCFFLILPFYHTSIINILFEWLASRTFHNMCVQFLFSLWVGWTNGWIAVLFVIHLPLALVVDQGYCCYCCCCCCCCFPFIILEMFCSLYVFHLYVDHCDSLHLTVMLTYPLILVIFPAW